MDMPPKRNKRRRQKTAAAILVLVLAGIAASGVFLWNQWDSRKEQVTAEADNQNTKGIITYQEKQYKYNEHLSNFLFMGIDTREKQETKTGKADAGQADVLFLLSWDRKEHTVTAISVPRDTMGEIQVFTQDGKSGGMTEDHINLAYAYGDGGSESCQLMEDAVSRLFYGLPIQGSCSINMDGIGVLAGAVGGVEVTVPDDSLAEVNPQWTKGAQILLDEENTETFVRHRDTREAYSAMGRLNRQQVFLSAYAQKAEVVYKEDPSILTEMYESLEPYMESSISKDQLAKSCRI